jgi:hypothetical protein
MEKGTMARKPEDVDPNEIKTSQYKDFIILALAKLGGSARKEPVIELVGEWFKDQFKPCDERPMYHRPKPYGWQLAPAGYTGETTPVWAVKTSLAFRLPIDEGLAFGSEGKITLTQEGLKYVAQLMEEGKNEQN